MAHCRHSRRVERNESESMYQMITASDVYRIGEYKLLACGVMAEIGSAALEFASEIQISDPKVSCDRGRLVGRHVLL